MRATPIPDSFDGYRAVIGPADPTRDDLRPCEYAVLPSREYPGPGQFRVLARIELDDHDRALIAQGAVIWLELDGGELPWQLYISTDEEGVPGV